MTREDYIKTDAWIWLSDTRNVPNFPDGKVQIAVMICDPIGSHENFTQKIVDGWVEGGALWSQELINDPSIVVHSIKYVP